MLLLRQRKVSNLVHQWQWQALPGLCHLTIGPYRKHTWVLHYSVELSYVRALTRIYAVGLYGHFWISYTKLVQIFIYYTSMITVWPINYNYSHAYMVP